MPKVITFTPNPALDVSITVDHMVPEDKLRCEEPVREPGGGGVNVSRALKRMGVPSIAIHTAGGHIGRLYGQLLDEEGIQRHPFEVEGSTRESIMVLDRKENNLYRFVTPGGKLEEAEWKKLLEVVHDHADADYLVASGSLPPGAPSDLYAQLSDVARERDIRLVLDTSGKALQEIIRSGAYLIKPNKKELGELVGRELKNEDQIKGAAEEIISGGKIEVLVISMSGEGAMLATRDGVEKLSAPQVKKVSSVGAGDSMVAGMVAKLVAGEDIRTAVRYGLACGSAAIMTPGSELMRKEDADRLFGEMRD
jgi:6-phosphofructokinase 2